MKAKIIGMHKLLKKLDPERFHQVQKQALLFGGELLKGEIIKKTPIDTGILRQSYKTKLESSEKVIIYNTKKYGLYVHEGTKPHWTSIKNVAKWANRHGINPRAVQWAIAKNGTKGKKWIDKVLQDKGEKIMEKIENFIMKQINNV